MTLETVPSNEAEPFKSARPNVDPAIEPETDTEASTSNPSGLIEDPLEAHIVALGQPTEDGNFAAKKSADNAAEWRSKAENVTPEEAHKLGLNTKMLRERYTKRANSDQESAEFHQDRAAFFYDNGVDITETATPKAGMSSSDWEKEKDPKVAELEQSHREALKASREAAMRVFEEKKAA